MDRGPLSCTHYVPGYSRVNQLKWGRGRIHACWADVPHIDEPALVGRLPATALPTQGESNSETEPASDDFLAFILKPRSRGFSGSLTLSGPHRGQLDSPFPLRYISILVGDSIRTRTDAFQTGPAQKANRVLSPDQRPIGA